MVGDTDRTGTIITFSPDTTIFTQTVEFKFDLIANRMRELAFLNPEITIEVVDLRDEEELREVFHYDGGVKDFVRYLDENREPLMPDPIHIYTDDDADLPMAIAIQYNRLVFGKCALLCK